MGNTCSRLCFKHERWWQAKFEKSEDQANEYSTLIEEDVKSTVDETVSLTTNEKKMLENRDYKALIDQQTKFEFEAAKQLEVEEEALKEAEELLQQTRRDAARAARTRQLWSNGDVRTEADRPWTSFANDSSEEDEEFGEFLKSVKVSNLTAKQPPSSKPANVEGQSESSKLKSQSTGADSQPASVKSTSAESKNEQTESTHRESDDEPTETDVTADTDSVERT